jgi:hypothetical protein
MGEETSMDVKECCAELCVSIDVSMIRQAGIDKLETLPPHAWGGNIDNDPGKGDSTYSVLGS